MRKKAIITTAVAALLLLAVVAAGLNAIFTVTYVKADFLTFSAEGERDARALQEDLDAFVGKSTTFLKLKDVSLVTEKYPCFHLESAGKKFPKTIELTLSERKETLAYPKEEGGFATFDEDGVYLCDREENISRTGGENILLEGFSLTYAYGKATEGEYFGELLSAFSAFSAELEEIRANILSVRLMRNGSNPKMDSLSFFMREGVVIEISNPSFRIEDKVWSALQKYFSLKDGDRLTGYITAVETISGEDIFCGYTRG